MSENIELDTIQDDDLVDEALDRTAGKAAMCGVMSCGPK
jgi:hypothetical protein